MKRFKEAAIISAITLSILAVGVVTLRSLAPGLLGVGRDLRVVQLSKTLPAFYENVFRSDETGADGYILNDPSILVRAPVLYPDRLGIGPNDVLGFRNRSVPNVADVVVIGDSQTYGNNAILEDNWPSSMKRALGTADPVVYNMSTGGWGAVQYLATFDNALRFQPRAVVVAFYTGNDSLESTIVARNIRHWQFLLDEHDDSIAAIFPAPKNAGDSTVVPAGAGDWRVALGKGFETTFTPALRSLCNDPNYGSAMVGYAIMAKVAKHIATKAGAAGVKVFFTIIPTKELAFKALVEQSGVKIRKDYAQLIRDEQGNIRKLSEYLRSLGSATYVDVVEPLQAAILSRPQGMYPPGEGHPWPAGYRVIGTAIAKEIASALLPAVEGIYAVTAQKGHPFDVVSRDLNIAGGVPVFEDSRGKLAYITVRNGQGTYLDRVPPNASEVPVIGVRDVANRSITSTLPPE